MSRWLLVALPLLFVGCKKKAPESGGGPSGPKITAEMPAGPEARAFARDLLDVTITGLQPTGGSEFEVQEMTFAPDGTWDASSRLALGVEAVDCQETGTWRIEEMEGPAAIMVWEITKSTCPNRSGGDEQRLQMEITDDGTYKIAFR